MAEPVTFTGLEVPKHPEAETDFDHADLQFHNVDHSGHSYEVRVYLNNADATAETGRDEGQGYAGSFHIFGHGGCYGQEGHCDPKRRGDHPFDYRLPHPLEPMMKSLEVTDALKAHRGQGADELSVTLVPIRYDSAAEYARDAKDDIGVDSVSLVTYETALAQ
jgi:tyrosinase